jgi:hypothetical protein
MIQIHVGQENARFLREAEAHHRRILVLLVLAYALVNLEMVCLVMLIQIMLMI